MVKRYAQPQIGPVTLDLTNPVNRGGLVCVSYGEGLAKNFFTGRPPDLQIGDFSRRPGIFGISDRAYYTGNQDQFSFFSTTDFGLMAVVDFSTTLGSTASILGGDGSSNRAFQFRFNTSNQLEFIRFDTGGTPYFCTVAAPSRKGVVIGVSIGNTFKVYFNGSSVTSSISNTPQPATRVSLGEGFGFDASTGPDDHIFMGAVLSGAALDLAAQSVMANPWQLFAPTQRTVFKASAAGGAALSGSNAASTSASASLTTAINLAASASAKTANSAGLTTSIALAGSNAATTVGLSALGTQIALAASNTAVTSATAALSTGITLQASNAATTSASATLAGSGTLQASNAATTGGSVALTTAITIAAAASASTSASAALATSVNVTATNSATTSSSAALATAIQLVGQAAAAGSSSASLSTAIQLVASAAATTSASATLTVGSAPWSAAATASTMATVNLSTQIRLAATNAATTSASADLLIGTLAKDPRYIVSADARLFSLSASARPFGVAASARPFSVAISPRPWKVVAT